MCVLTHDEILKEIKAGNIMIEAFNIKNIGFNSADLTLDNKSEYISDSIIYFMLLKARLKTL